MWTRMNCQEQREALLMKIKCCEVSKMHGISVGTIYKVIEHNRYSKCYLIKNDTKRKVWVFAFNFTEIIDNKGFDKFMDKCDLTALDQYM